MEIIYSFETDCECWAVAVVGDRFATTCDPWSKTPSIRMFTMEGKYVRIYQKDNSGRQLFAYPEHIATDSYQNVMYISDSRLHSVTALTVEGCLMFRYKHMDLSYPSGVATDNQGNLYVCGKESRNVHQVSKTGQIIRILMDSTELEAPRAISFQQDGENMIVTDVGNTNCDEFITASLE
jgi:sugar lactone lactonase YvrE